VRGSTKTGYQAPRTRGVGTGGSGWVVVPGGHEKESKKMTRGKARRPMGEESGRSSWGKKNRKAVRAGS